MRLTEHGSTIRTIELAINIEWNNKSFIGAEAESETVLAAVCCFYCFDRMHGRRGGENWETIVDTILFILLFKTEIHLPWKVGRSTN
jgi:hypothetical protein